MASAGIRAATWTSSRPSAPVPPASAASSRGEQFLTDDLRVAGQGEPLADARSTVTWSPVVTRRISASGMSTST